MGLIVESRTRADHSARPGRLILLLYLILLAPDLATADDKPHVDIDWREIRRCGPNSLYVMLSVSGHSVDYDELIAATDLTDRGVSVAELQRVAGIFGMPLKAWRATPEQLTSMPTPAILHLETDWQRHGHYLLLLSVNEDNSCTVLDATRGGVRRLPRGDLFDNWGGVILTAATHSTAQQWTLLPLLTTSILMLACCITLASQYSGVRSAPTNIS